MLLIAGKNWVLSEIFTGENNIENEDVINEIDKITNWMVQEQYFQKKNI